MDSSPPDTRRPSRWERLAELQHRSPARFLLVGLLLALGSLPLVAELGLDSAFTALLPEERPSVRDLEAVRSRLGGTSQLTICIQSKNVEAMRRFAGDLVHRIEPKLPENVRSVEWNVTAYEDFVTKHRALYADVADLEEIRDSLDERIEWEKANANPLFVSLDDEEPPDPEEIIERMRKRAEERTGKRGKRGGYFIHPVEDLLAIFLRTDIRGGDAEGTRALIAWLEEHVRGLVPERYAPDLRVEYAGSLLHEQEEHDAIARELTLATSLAVLGVLLVIVLFYRRFAPIPLMGIALAVPTLVTFAFAELAVDYLNSSTAFLGSIVVGNGINPNIIWLARYFEERRRGHGNDRALLETHAHTWLGTLTASCAAATAYGSLLVTDFRGFRDFGLIGGLGMLLCWLGAVLLLPAAVTLYDRVRPLRPPADRKGRYGVLFARLVITRPRAVLVASGLVALVSLAAAAYAVAQDPIEYDFRNLRSVREKSSRATILNGRVKETVGSTGAGQAIVIVLDRESDVPTLKAELERKRDEQGAPYGKVRAVQDLLPRDQDAKRPIIGEVRKRLLEARAYANEKQQAHIDEHLPPETVTPLAVADLPAEVARPFTERDGTRGRLLFVEQKKSESLWDGRYLVRWAAALREVRLPDGSRPPLAGNAPVFADMIEVVWTDGPKSVLASFVATTALLSLGFRRLRERLLALTALLLGILWMGGTMALLGMRLNFLNFVAFPITFGNGVDYAVNVLRRFVAEQAADPEAVREAVRHAVEETGGAVTLCSLTTIIGYASLHVSSNKALNSFGTAMAMSELTCLAAAVLTMPALIVLSSARSTKS